MEDRFNGDIPHLDCFNFCSRQLASTVNAFYFLFIVIKHNFSLSELNQIIITI